MDKEQEITETIISSEILKPCLDDIELFIAELEEIDDRIGKVVEKLRQQMLDDKHILTAQLSEPQHDLQAVDAAVVPLDRSGVSIVLGSGVRYGPQTKVEYHREMNGNFPDTLGIRIALRLQLELRLLKDCTCNTVIDGSFWSLLMDSNKVITARRNSDNTLFKEQYQECYETEGTFLQMIRNPKLIAMSKSAVSKSLSTKTRREGGYKELLGETPISDRSLYTAILEPGEFSRPMSLSAATQGKFGVERGFIDWEEIKEIYEEGLFVTYYRPWPYHRAYRIEYHQSEFSDKSEAIKHLFAQIKHDTREVTIMEPLCQFWADYLAKQISAAARLYVEVGRRRFPDLFGPYRTEKK